MNSYQQLFNTTNPHIRDGQIGLLCNQTAFDAGSGRYLFQLLAEKFNLKRLFFPEHGLFAELQDQVPLDSSGAYRFLNMDCEFRSLYGSTDKTLRVDAADLSDLDALIVDIQDVGSRYYTFATTLSYLLEKIAAHKPGLLVYIIDHPNPAGRKVEGTPLDPVYESFVGRPGLVHRHGLTIGELALFYQHQIGAELNLEIAKYTNTGASGLTTWDVPPSPNMPGPYTPLVYTGQCLLEGTNLSEGRGTTRPFEIFGAPFLTDTFKVNAWPHEPGAVLRPLKFIPTFHKHAQQVCSGFQVHLTGPSYNSLAHSLKFLRYVKDHFSAFEWRTQEYEFISDKPAIEILAGDEALISYLYGEEKYSAVREKMTQEELKWMDTASQFLLYSQPLYRADLKPEFDYA